MGGEEGSSRGEGDSLGVSVGRFLLARIEEIKSNKIFINY